MQSAITSWRPLASLCGFAAILKRRNLAPGLYARSTGRRQMEEATMISSVAFTGGRELQRCAQEYWLLGLALSILIHLSLVGTCYLADINDRGTRVPSLPPGDIVPRGPTVFVPGIDPLNALRPGRGVLSRGKGIPVPVRNPSVDVPYPAQGEPGGVVEPGGIGTGEGVGEEIRMPPEVDTEPPPFRPVEIEPRVIQSAVPEYPRLAVETGLEGKVWVKIWVDASGKPRKAVVVKGDAEVLNQAAIAAAMKFLFTPAVMNGGPVSVWVAIPFSFKLH